MKNISFTSYIKPVEFDTFQKITTRIPKTGFVAPPWTLKESRLGYDVFTKSVMDCSVYIISDGQKAKMYHICPGCDDAKNFFRIENDIKITFDLKNENVEAFILGGKQPHKIDDESYKLFEKFEKFSDKHNIPTTILKGGNGERSFAYLSTTDTLYITNTDSCKKNLKQPAIALNILKNWFDKVVIHPKDSVSI